MTKIFFLLNKQEIFIARSTNQEKKVLLQIISIACVEALVPDFFRNLLIWFCFTR